jgi:hypothetical protein
MQLLKGLREAGYGADWLGRSDLFYTFSIPLGADLNPVLMSGLPSNPGLRMTLEVCCGILNTFFSLHVDIILS